MSGACYSEATFFGMKDSIYGAIDRVILGGFGVSRYPPILILALALVNPCLAVEVPSRRTHQRPCACGGSRGLGVLKVTPLQGPQRH
ncbi:hypothetical protein PNOK_0573700 [Pyrrhoderma noxium]|uniref:Uncharacterized protein n=1 Tax=Pyrrhoderma noxium TaxID=2282107 RepID=A0A286UHE1_9AGAM|nr:hypothetical protein PNOK_0573700 [Pyrrhoderma noxium]